MNFDYSLPEQPKMSAADAALRAAGITPTVQLFVAQVEGGFQRGVIHRIVVDDNDANRATAILSAPRLRSTLA